MKKLFILTLFACLHFTGFAQSTWFKLMPGWHANNCEIINDTLLAFCLTDDNNANAGIAINKLALNTGYAYKGDSFFYKSPKLNKIMSIGYWSINQTAVSQNNKQLIFGSPFLEETPQGIKWQSDLFAYPSFNRIQYDMNYDTFDTKIEGYFEIHHRRYAIVNWTKQVGDKLFKTSNRLLQVFDSGKISLIYTIENNGSGAASHQLWFNDVMVDNQNEANLFMPITDNWDWHGEPASFETDVIKLDTHGNQLWICRPNLNWDSTNTTNFQMVQKPNGNILCCWLDLYYRPYKTPEGGNRNEDANKNATLWFAEIDYETGKVLWNKNIRQYLGWKLSAPTARDFLLLADAKILEDNTVVWVGYRPKDYPYPLSYKYLPFLLKTDQNGNPLWYREYDFYPTDTGDKGMLVSSFIEAPDKGFILTGEYRNQGGQLSNGEFWQKSCILKVDSNGCFEPGCDKADRVISINYPKNVCTVYPNPAKDEIYIQYPVNTEGWQVSVIDMTGKLLLESTESRINTIKLPNGNYQLILKNLKNYHYETHQITVSH